MNVQLGYFSTPEEQIENLKRWNQTVFKKTKGYNLSSVSSSDGRPRFLTEYVPFAFSAAEISAIPTPPTNGNVSKSKISVLVPYTGKIGRTFNLLLEIIGSNQESNSMWFPFNLLNGGYSTHNLNLYPRGAKEKRQIVWEVIDFESHEGENPYEVREKFQRLPGAAVLAALAHCSKWYHAMRKRKITPSNVILMPGYEIGFPGDKRIPGFDMVPPIPSWGSPRLDVWDRYCFFNDNKNKRLVLPVYSEE